METCMKYEGECSNRTFMELKFFYEFLSIDESDSSNRTFMELK